MHRGVFPSFSSLLPFIPAFLLDNERPGYRKERRAAYGRRRERLLTYSAIGVSRDSAANYYRADQAYR